MKKQWVKLPWKAVRDGSFVYMYENEKLEIRELDIMWKNPDYLWVDKALEEGDEVITSPLSAPLEGMKLKKTGEKASSHSSATRTEKNGENNRGS